MLAVDAAATAAHTFDLIVIGAGGAGMAAALFAAIGGQSVLLVERTEFVGGTTALSAGTVWVPNTPHAAAVGAQDSPARASTYLDQVVGTFADKALRETFLAQGPQALALLEQHTELKLRPYALHPDYESDLEGATLQGRAMEPLPFDGRLLGTRFALLRPPIPEFTVLGGMMVDRTDVNHLLAATGSLKSLRHALKIVARQLRDRLGHARGTRLVMGNALVARLLHSLLQRQVPIWTRTQVERLHIDAEGRISGVTLLRDGLPQPITARRGVVLASGGFNRHPQLRAQWLPAAATHTPGAPGHTGAAIALALQAGAHIGTNNVENAFWAPVSVRRRADGSSAVFPHFVLDRAKPGTVVVNQAGLRFVNESTSYHRFGAAMLAAHAASPCIPAYLIADARALKVYGLGMVRPGGFGLKGFIDEGYLVTGPTLRALAVQLGIDADALECSVARFNEHAASGIDPDFQRGSTAYQRNIGDASFVPNPNLGPVVQAPFYAVRLYPGDIGASAGLVTDVHARVLTQDGRAIDGLYAIGNDMNSVMGGTYPGPGITIGPALTFAYIASQHAAQASVA